MYEYITAELPQVLQQFPELDVEKASSSLPSTCSCSERAAPPLKSSVVSVHADLLWSLPLIR